MIIIDQYQCLLTIIGLFIEYAIMVGRWSADYPSESLSFAPFQQEERHEP
jgi:hypothetical protein